MCVCVYQPLLFLKLRWLQALMVCSLAHNQNENFGIGIIDMFTTNLKNEIHVGPMILGFITKILIPKGG